MGASGSKTTKKISKLLLSRINEEVRCPFCGSLFAEILTYKELNYHLSSCNKITKNCVQNIYLDEENNNKKYNSDSKIQKINSDPLRENNNLDLQNTEEFRNTNTLNDFQLVIDYNNVDGQNNNDIYEEKLKKKGDKEEIIGKYLKLRNFIMNKKNLMNYKIEINAKNYNELFRQLKNINLYCNTNFIIKNNSGIKEVKLESIINKYFETKIKLHHFEIINEDNLLSFSFENNDVDFEMLGIIISILIINSTLNIKFILPLFLFKTIVNQNLTVEDIVYENKELYEKCDNLLNNKKIAELNLNYTCEGNELIIGGLKTKVNLKNVHDYVDKLVNYQMQKNKNKINIIKNSLFQSVPKHFILLFNAEQLEKIVNKREYELEDDE